MSEFIGKKLRPDDAAVELENMEKIHLFDKMEIKAIAKKRKEFEYKIIRRTKCKDDYIRYIQYELELLKTIRENKEQKNIPTLKKAEVEQAITTRVDKLFKNVIHKFQGDVRLWTFYMKFCKQVGLIESATAMMMRMVSVHSDKPELWKMAAVWEYKENNNMENARRYLLHGLRLHAESKVLYEEAFRLELNYANTRRKAKAEQAAEAVKEEEEGGEPKLTTEEPAPTTSVVTNQPQDDRPSEVFFESAIHKVDSVQFYIDLLSIAKEYDFTERLQDRIVNHLLSKYRNDELAWDTMARRELEGFSYSAHTLLPGCQASPAPLDKKKTSFKERIRLCVTVYSAVVKQLNTERMWSLYLETLIELNQDLVNLPTFKQNLLKAAFQEAHSAGRLQEKYYLQWVDLLQSTSKFNKLGLVLRQATERFSSNVELWLMRLRFHLARDEEALGGEVFNLAHNSLGAGNETTLPLFKILIQYYQVKDTEKAQTVFENGIKMGPAVSNVLKPRFLEWLLLMKGIVAVHKEYEYLAQQDPPCLELHTKMIFLETMQPDMNAHLVRKCFESACSQFGKENADIWLDYARFEMDNGDENNIGAIFERAKKTLDPLLVEMIVREFDLIQGGLQIKMETQVI